MKRKLMMRPGMATALLAFLLASALSAQIKLPAMFSDNMVLQRQIKIPVWGTAPAGSKVTVQLQQQTKTARADAAGKWRVNLEAMPAGGPHQLAIMSADTITLNNVMIGEVWLCSGQSNMEMPLVSTWAKVDNFEAEVAAANFPELRLFIAKRAKSTRPREDVESEGWKICDPTSVKDFSATAFFFGRHLQQKLGVPVGLMQSAWGGTVVEAWTSGASLKTMPDIASFVHALETTTRDSIFDSKIFEMKLQEWYAALEAKDAATQGQRAWSSAEYDDFAWPVMNLPQKWERAGLPSFDGLLWYRKTVTLPEAFAGQSLTLELGPIDDYDWTFFNGVQIGTTPSYNALRRYQVPRELVRPGKNLIAIRVLDTGGDGGLYGRPEQLKLMKDSTASIALAGEWRYKMGLPLQDLPLPPSAPTSPNRPTVLYNAMIAPLVPYALRGAIWYQGESNAGRAYQYRELFPLLIKDWRKQWQQGDFPFLFVQLANFRAQNADPIDDDWAELREAQTMTLALPNTGMAVTIDIGDANDIHPGNKQDVGNRLALNARALVYGEKIAYSGPKYKTMKIEGNRIRLSFEHASEGLKAKNDEELQGFAIAGADKKFVWANAKIEGNTVVVSAASIAQPVAVRYAWSINPRCNLYNKAGLPALPFRTDAWPEVTRTAHVKRSY